MKKDSLAERTHSGFLSVKALKAQAKRSQEAVKADAERIMLKAGQDSQKPNDLFKVKKENKGKPEYEGPLHAYRTLVKSTRRPGEYWMPCAENLYDA